MSEKERNDAKKGENKDKPEHGNRAEGEGSPKGKRILLRTFGCQMNERDSEIICSMMMDEGYTPTASIDDADLIIFNTCSVRKHAEDRVWGKMDEFKKLKRKRKFIIGLVGCMGKAYGRDVFKRLPHIDFVSGPANIYDIPDLVEKIGSGARHAVAIGRKKRPADKISDGYREEDVIALVNISEGCNNFCSYCIVPYVRGEEVSRPAKDILDEIKESVDKGTKEVNLLGQNVNSYKDGRDNFISLLEAVNKIDGIKRIRFMTSHPKDVDDELFRAMRGLDKVCEHLHLPVQSGSDRVLKLMKRGYTVSHYMRLVDDFRKVVGDSAITTDVIVGFPSEKDEDFKDTYMLMKKVGFDSAFILKYSPRPFTKESGMQDDVSPSVKLERNQALLNLQDKIEAENNNRLLATLQEALGIKQAKRVPACPWAEPGFYIKGRTRQNKQVIYKGSKDLIGKIARVKIKDIEGHTLIGEVI